MRNGLMLSSVIAALADQQEPMMVRASVQLPVDRNCGREQFPPIPGSCPGAACLCTQGIRRPRITSQIALGKEAVKMVCSSGSLQAVSMPW